MSRGRDDIARRREAMVDRDLRARGIRDRRVLEAMRAVPREHFVPPDLTDAAYADHPLPIGEGQTISQPYIVALMAEAAEVGPSDRVLEVGAGSGYGAAVLGRLAAEVWAVECLPGLAASATDRLAELGADNVTVVTGDGTMGVADAAPFDAIVVTAGGPEAPAALLDQLAEGGRLVIPIGPQADQRLVRIRRRGEQFDTDDLGGVRFVPLVGEQGWPS